MLIASHILARMCADMPMEVQARLSKWVAPCAALNAHVEALHANAKALCAQGGPLCLVPPWLPLWRP